MFAPIFTQRASRSKPLREIGNIDATGYSLATLDFSLLVDCTTMTLTGASNITHWKLPPDLTALFCSDWDRTTMPALPNTLITLYCDNSALLTLPPLPDSLSTLFCQSNSLIGLPNIPANLSYLGCQDCDWSSAQVNTLLAQLVARGIENGTLDCSGSNAAPTGQGLVDAVTLVDRNWTITTS